MALGHHRRAPVALAERARRGERGAVLVLVALSVAVLVTAVAFTVDLGRASVLRRDLQKTADVVALDLARRLDGRTTAAIVADPAFAAAFSTSLQRNGFVRDADTRAAWRIGHWDPRTETFTPTTATEVPESVEVTVTDRLDYEFAPGGATTSRRGIASNRPVAAFQLGSFAARLDPSTSPLLDALLGQTIGVTAGGYTGLAGGRVQLGALLDQLSLDLGQPDQVMAASVTVAQLLTAEAAVLRAGGDATRAALLERTILSLPNPQATIPLARLMTLGVGTGDAAAATTVDAFDLLAASAFVANGTNFLSVPAASLGIPGLAVTSARVQVIQGPVLVVGGIGATGSTAQVRVELDVAGSVPGVTDLGMHLVLTSASATARVDALSCGSPQQLDVGVQTGLVTLADPITARVYASLPLVGNVPVADVALNAAVSRPGSSVPLELDFPPARFGVPVQAATSGLNLGNATVTVQRTTVLGALPAGPLLDGVIAGVVTGTITPTLAAVDATLLTPLLRALGTTVAGADITPLAVTCDGTALAG